MKSIALPKQTGALCDITIILVILLSGCNTGIILHELTTPLPKGEYRIDAMFEISTIASILNLALPLGFAALAGSGYIKIRAKTVKPLPIALSLAGLIGVGANAIAMYSMLATAHVGINLWSNIWWRFGK